MKPNEFLKKDKIDEELTPAQKMRMSSISNREEQQELQTINKTMTAMQQRIRSLSDPDEKEKLQARFNDLLRRKHSIEGASVSEASAQDMRLSAARHQAKSPAPKSPAFLGRGSKNTTPSSSNVSHSIHEESLNEYLNPVEYIVCLFKKAKAAHQAEPSLRWLEKPTKYESRSEALTYASEMPSDGSVVVGHNRDNNSIKLVRSDFDNNISNSERKEMKQVALNYCKSQLKHSLPTKTNEANEGVDTIEMDVELFIRCLEWAKESAPDDIALHKFTENVVAKNGILTMDDYESLVPQGAPVEEDKYEDEEAKYANIEKIATKRSNEIEKTGDRVYMINSYTDPETKRMAAELLIKRKDGTKDKEIVREDASAGGTSSASIATVVSGTPEIIKRTGYKKKGRYGNSFKSLSKIGKGIYEAEVKIKKSDPRPVDNFTADDLKELEQIRDLPTLKTRAFELISTKSQHQMKPEKVEWFKQNLEKKNDRMSIIKLMYDLLLAGEGHSVIGSKNSMKSNSYRSIFSEGSINWDAYAKSVAAKNKAAISAANPPRPVKKSTLELRREKPIEWENLGWDKIQRICDKNWVGLGGEIVDVIDHKSRYINVEGTRVAAVRLTVHVAYNLEDYGYDQETIDKMGGDYGMSDAINVTLYRDPLKPSVIKAQY